MVTKQRPYALEIFEAFYGDEKKLDESTKNCGDWLDYYKPFVFN
jgi:hypothetical protein